MRSRYVAFLLAGAAMTLACSSSPRRPDGQVGLLPVGSMAHDVEAVDASGASTRLSALRGQAVVVYFYPADGTPGCTREACALRDAWTKLQAAHVSVIGVSSQSRASHLAFEKEHHLPFPLAADVDGEVQRAYGVPKGFFGYSRVSFLVDPSGRIAKVWPDVDPAIHADEVLAAARALPR
ncbi:MAG: peroxiredoxin [Myxococcota bacterium]|nr:peroxiredoxin [Myxococcota bacterium]